MTTDLKQWVLENYGLPENWSPPTWLKAPDIITPSSCDKRDNISNLSLTVLDRFRDAMRRPLYKLDQKAWFRNYHWVALIGVMTLSVMTSFSSLMPVALLVTLIGCKCFESLIRLNDADLQKLHKIALNNPMYAKVWARAQSYSIPCTIHAISFEKGIRSGRHIHSNSLNRIEIRNTSDMAWALQVIFYETCNAANQVAFDSLKEKLVLGEIEREEFARIMEYIEFFSLKQTKEISQFPTHQYHLNYRAIQIPSFREMFLKETTPSAIGKNDSHTDRYRRLWDRATRSRNKSNAGTI